MSDQSHIQWTDATWNPSTGCDRISPGCDHCYALTLAKRLKAMGSVKYQADGDPRTSGPGFGVTVHEDALDAPLRWRRPRRVFVNSMSDLGHARIPRLFVAQVFAVMALSPQHTFQVLTKRPGRLASVLGRSDFRGLMAAAAAEMQAERPQLMDRFVETGRVQETWPLPNVWIGASIESDEYCWRANDLRRVPASTRFLSLEPLLGPVPSLDLAGIDWVIIGGESGPGARPMDSLWAMDLVVQCSAAGVPMFVKQLGSVWARENGAADRKGGDPAEWPKGLRERNFPATADAARYVPERAA